MITYLISNIKLRHSITVQLSLLCKLHLYGILSALLERRWKMRDSLIFDMDGVLIDSQPLHFEIDLEVLKRCGASPKYSDVVKYAGLANKDRWPKYKSDFSLKPDVSELIDMHVNTLMRIFRETALVPAEGITELLRLLHSTHIKTAVASSSSLDLISLVLEKLKLTHYFSHIVTGEDLANGKPSPDIFLHACRLLESYPENCAVIEDSTNGVLAAKAAGMYCIAYRNRTSGPQDLAPADITIDSFNEINLAWLQEELCI
jgi:HAD superfamily hydrolase (TIGR01509 family)